MIDSVPRAPTLDNTFEPQVKSPEPACARVLYSLGTLPAGDTNTLGKSAAADLQYLRLDAVGSFVNTNSFSTRYDQKLQCHSSQPSVQHL